MPEQVTEHDPFPDVPEFNEAFRLMFADIHGFVYMGTNLEATISTIKWLRTHPGEAALLLRDF